MVKIVAVGIQEFEAEQGQRLVLSIKDAGIDILHRCGGNARCTTCRVEILEGNAGEPNEREAARLAREDQLAPNIRLSCQVLVREPLTLRVINRLSETELSDAGPRPTDQLEPIA